MDIRQKNTEQKRLRILDEDELKNIYGRPNFTHEERCNYFFLSQPEKDLFNILRSVKSRAYFVLQLGYFKAKNLFFTFNLHEVEEDLQYVLKQYFDNSKIFDMNSVDKFTRLKQQQLILQLFQYHICDTEIRRQLEVKACNAAAVCGKPIFIFREIVNYLSKQRIVVPGYSFMQETVGKAIIYEQNRLVAIMQNNLKQHDIEALNQLLKDSSGCILIEIYKNRQVV